MAKSVPKRAQISTVTKYDRQKAKQKRLARKHFKTYSQTVAIFKQSGQ